MFGFSDPSGWTEAFFEEWWESIKHDLKVWFRRKFLYGRKR